MFELFDPDADVRISSGCNLPHWFQPGVTYFVTFRTHDSIPKDVSQKWYHDREGWLKNHGISVSDPNWSQWISRLPKELVVEYHNKFSKLFLEYLDQGYGECLLSCQDLAKIVKETLQFFDGERYHLGDFIVMPNHVHLLVGLIGKTDIVDLCYSWKKFSARKINRAMSRSGRFWQEDSFDHLVRSASQFSVIQKYIRNNPINLPDGTYLYCPK